MMQRAINAVLAFAIRYRVSPTGRAIIKPRLSVVDGRATPQTSSISELPSMAKAHAEIDNHFTPYVQPGEDSSMLAIVLVTIVAALFVAAFGLARSVGAI